MDGVVCTDCETGRYSASDGASHCSRCSPGTAVNPEKTDCIACDPGKFGKDGIECTPCPKGTYSEDTGSTNCTLAPAGTRTVEEIGATVFVHCNGDNGKNNKYAPAGSAKCDECASGLEIKLGSQASSSKDCVCKNGFYKTYLDNGEYDSC